MHLGKLRLILIGKIYYMKIHFLFVACIISFYSFAQTEAVLDANNTAIIVGGRGQMILNYGVPSYTIPKTETGIKKSTLFSSALWVGGLDDDGKIHLTASLYGSHKGQDFWNGPSSKNPLLANAKYNKSWVVSQSDIIAHQNDYSLATNDILTWPGNGDTLNGEPWLLAPFVDKNNNGKYEPLLGDYPKIKGFIAAYCIYNDNHGDHTLSKSEPLNIDVHQLFYQEEKGALGGVFDHTNLGWIKIVNRSKNKYHDLRVGVFMDADIGYGYDDLMGTDTLRNLSYAYNGDSYDEGETGYGLNPPAQGVKFLNQKLAASVVIPNNSGVIGIPDTATHFYNYLGGKDKLNNYFTTHLEHSTTDTLFSPFVYAG